MLLSYIVITVMWTVNEIPCGTKVETVLSSTKCINCECLSTLEKDYYEDIEEVK